MRKKLLLGLSIILISSTAIQAQNWVNGGNSLSGIGRIGTNSNHSLLFETYNLERGRITNSGLWGIGTTTPNSKVHINSITNQDPLRVMYNGSTKMLVHRSGGVAIGAAVTPPANGLHVAGNVAIGTTSNFAKLDVINGTGDGIYTTGVDVGLEANGTGEHGVGLEANGTGEYGIGVWAKGVVIGLRAGDTNGSVGVLGDGKSTGVYGFSPNVGLEGYGKNDGVFGHSDDGTGGRFQSSYGFGLYASTGEGSYAGYFDGDVYTSGLYYGSDKNIKKNIQEMGNATSLISKLKPKNYEFRNDGKYASLKLPKGSHFGLLAQDVEEVFPELVKETSHEVREHKPMPTLGPDGKLDLSAIKRQQAGKEKEKITIKAVNYTELIPIMIKGMQEQQQTIQEQAKIIQKQQQEIDEFKERFTKIEAALGSGKDGFTGGLNGTSMLQVFPNPVGGTTNFNYSITKGASGKILIYNASGQLVRTLVAPDSGQVQMNASGLSAGKYTATLVVDSKVITSNHILVE